MARSVKSSNMRQCARTITCRRSRLGITNRARSHSGSSKSCSGGLRVVELCMLSHVLACSSTVTPAHTHTHAHTCARAQAYMHDCTDTPMHAHARTHAQKYTHARGQACHACRHRHARTHPWAHLISGWREAEHPLPAQVHHPSLDVLCRCPWHRRCLWRHGCARFPLQPKLCQAAHSATRTSGPMNGPIL